jgi:hypothetical protein
MRKSNVLFSAMPVTTVIADSFADGTLVSFCFSDGTEVLPQEEKIIENVIERKNKIQV